MINRRLIVRCILLVIICYSSFLFDQEKKLEKLRVGGGSTSAMQISLWLAKEGNYYEEKPFPKAKAQNQRTSLTAASCESWIRAVLSSRCSLTVELRN
jgi:hypothetical protein